MSTASPASLWRLRVAYLILKSSNVVLDAFQERAKLLLPVAGRRDSFSMAITSFDAQVHLLNLMATACFAREAFKRLFKEVELASSKEGATCAANAESMEMPASQPLKNLRHEAFAQRIAARASATAAYADAYGRPRDNVAAVRGGQLIRKVNMRPKMPSRRSLRSVKSWRASRPGRSSGLTTRKSTTCSSPPIGLPSSWDR
jgi:hypothetical protein